MQLSTESGKPSLSVSVGGMVVTDPVSMIRSGAPSSRDISQSPWVLSAKQNETPERMLCPVICSVPPAGVVAERAAAYVAAHSDHPRPDRLVLNQPRR